MLPRQRRCVLTKSDDRTSGPLLFQDDEFRWCQLPRTNPVGVCDLDPRPDSAPSPMRESE